MSLSFGSIIDTREALLSHDWNEGPELIRFNRVCSTRHFRAAPPSPAQRFQEANLPLEPPRST